MVTRNRDLFDVVSEEEEEETLPIQYSITSYGADYPVDGLVKRMEAGDIVVPRFQRGYVWTNVQASRFIESLLLGLPVPGIFLSKEQDTQKLLVVDGQQRLSTLRYFYDGIFSDSGREFALRGVQSKFLGKTYKTLPEQDVRLLNDSTIHATIVKQDEPTNDSSGIFYIFERLNTGGTLLKPHEIRSGIFHGQFIELLRSLNADKDWRAIYGPPAKDLRDQELILRFFALFYELKNYRKPMMGFLNRFTRKNMHLTRQFQEQLTNTFEETIRVIHEAIGNRAFRLKNSLNAALFDAVMVGVATRLMRGPISKPAQLETVYREMLTNSDFLGACTTATTDEANVKTRLEIATAYFSRVE